MMKKILKVSAFLLAGVLCCQTVSAGIFNFGGVRTNIYSFSNKSFEGAESETRAMMPISGISNNGPLNVVFIESDKNEVVVKGDKNLFCRVQTQYKDGVVNISLEPGTYRNVWLQVEVYGKTLNTLRCTGSGNVKAESIKTDAEEMGVKVTGSGVVTIGTLKCSRDLDMHISGSGDIMVKKVECKDVDIDVTGSGNVMVSDGINFVALDADIKLENVEGNAADMAITGSGEIRLLGGSINFVKARIAGSGEIRGHIKYKSIEQKTAGSGSIHISQD